MNSFLNPLIIGDLKINVPIIQGAMGVKVSTSSLASAVANCGAAGTIASVGLGYGTKLNEIDYVQASREGLQHEIREAKKSTKGVIGVNIMVALSNYEHLVKTAINEKVDFIAAGAGLPLNLPELIKNNNIKLLPIVSSARAANVIIKYWSRKYNKYPDAIIVEGPLAGGHLGFKFEELQNINNCSLEKIIKEVISITNKYTETSGIKIPIIAAGGIFDGKDAAKFFKLGVQGIQIATRLVTTYECSVPDEYKKAYINATEDDIILIKSPVGMPGRALKNTFLEKMIKGQKHPFKCNYICLRTCDPGSAPYCIAEALFNAVGGKIDNGLIFCGQTVSKINKIVSVKEVINEIVTDALKNLDN